FIVDFCFNNNPSVSTKSSHLSTAVSVGAIGLRPMVATGNPHPLHKGGYFLIPSTNPDLYA
ncbi:MAG: hypothetical protein U0L66_00075, partial [Acutalibacteraceae bacterium]|nr:hypothetical protein [Acutalibacteraceae bacterium]